MDNFAENVLLLLFENLEFEGPTLQPLIPRGLSDLPMSPLPKTPKFRNKKLKKTLLKYKAMFELQAHKIPWNLFN